jgi:hypothetical protein
MEKLRTFNDYKNNHTLAESRNNDFPKDVPESQYDSIDDYLESLKKLCII